MTENVTEKTRETQVLEYTRTAGFCWLAGKCSLKESAVCACWHLSSAVVVFLSVPCLKVPLAPKEFYFRLLKAGDQRAFTSIPTLLELLSHYHWYSGGTSGGTSG